MGGNSPGEGKGRALEGRSALPRLQGSEIASALLAQHPISVGQLQDVTLGLQHVSVLPGCCWHVCCRLFSPSKETSWEELSLPPLSCCWEDIRALIWVQSSPAAPARPDAAARLCALFLPLPNSDSPAAVSSFLHSPCSQQHDVPQLPPAVTATNRVTAQLTAT